MIVWYSFSSSPLCYLIPSPTLSSLLLFLSPLTLERILRPSVWPSSPLLYPLLQSLFNLPSPSFPSSSLISPENYVSSPSSLLPSLLSIFVSVSAPLFTSPLFSSPPFLSCPSPLFTSTQSFSSDIHRYLHGVWVEEKIHLLLLEQFYIHLAMTGHEVSC